VGASDGETVENARDDGRGVLGSCAAARPTTGVVDVCPGRPRPRHLAVILDGNRRWAQTHGCATRAGYQRGGERVLDLLTWCERYEGLEVVTLWPLSTENLRRAPQELGDLIQVIVETAERIAATTRWRIQVIGAPDRLPPPAHGALSRIAQRTAGRHSGTVNIAVAYGGRDEIARGVQKLVRAHQASGTLDGLVARGIGPEDIGRYLDTAGQPDPDLVIRTSGEQRMSGFMPWQTAYTEFYFTPVLWPDFSADDLAAAFAFYDTRQRRFGE
jgi:short-chain Z-isoprenyl diphosphate synthase